eukprot:UN33096
MTNKRNYQKQKIKKSKNKVPERKCILTEKEIESNYKNICQILKNIKNEKEKTYLLFMTGAGWSADSGLKVYNDIGKFEAYEKKNLEYQDLSTPRMLIYSPDLFYGFWGDCYDTYQNTKPHEGHKIVSDWLTKYFNVNTNNEDNTKIIKKNLKKIFLHIWSLLQM